MKSFKLYSILFAIGMLAFALGMIPASTQAQTSYCTPSYYYAGNYMWIDYVEVGDMWNSQGSTKSPGYTFFSNKKATAKTGEQFIFTLNSAIHMLWS